MTYYWPPISFFQILKYINTDKNCGIRCSSDIYIRVVWLRYEQDNVISRFRSDLVTLVGSSQYQLLSRILIYLWSPISDLIWGPLWAHQNINCCQEILFIQRTRCAIWFSLHTIEDLDILVDEAQAVADALTYLSPQVKGDITKNCKYCLSWKLKEKMEIFVCWAFWVFDFRNRKKNKKTNRK